MTLAADNTYVLNAPKSIRSIKYLLSKTEMDVLACVHPYGQMNTDMVKLLLSEE